MQPSKANILKARRQFYYSAIAAVGQAVRGEIKVNDLPRFVEWQKDMAVRIMTRRGNSFAVLQRAWYIQTGECVPFLPPVKPE